MAMISARDLRHSIVVERSTSVQNPKGGYNTAWAPIASVWAAIKGLDGRESVMAQVLEGISFYRLTIRWCDDLRQSDQIILDDGKRLNIRSIMDPDGRRRWLQILADTGSVERDT